MASTFEFLTPVDIANRALQHLGARRITAFTDDSKNASEIAFAYDKLRQAELRRNTWRFATRRVVLRAFDTGTMILKPLAWSSTLYYQIGDIISYDGINWVSHTAFNYGNVPGVDMTQWGPYYGPLSAEPVDATASYYTNELVYTSTTPGFLNLYAATAMGATGDPSVVAAYSASTTYGRGNLVAYLGSNYLSTIDLNFANTPGATSYAFWLAATSYSSGNKVITTDGKIWTSQTNANVGNNPTTDSGTNWLAQSGVPYYQPWILYAGGSYAPNWLFVGGGGNTPITEAAKSQLLFPLGTSPSTNLATLNVFRLPSGYLRTVPVDPKAGNISVLGGPVFNSQKDWVYEDKFIVTRDGGPIVLRFVTDFTAVAQMDTMFCEGLAARIAYELCETITQSTEKQKACGAAYKLFMGEARLANAVETGAVQPNEDEYISTRI